MKYTKQFHLRTTDTRHAQITQMAEELGLTINDIYNRLLETGLSVHAARERGYTLVAYDDVEKQTEVIFIGG